MFLSYIILRGCVVSYIVGEHVNKPVVPLFELLVGLSGRHD